MDNTEKIVKHLEIIQGVINRLGHDSFLVKGWSMSVLAVGIIFLARNGVQDKWFILAFLVPVAGFWVLDGYFLWQERLLRKVYDEVRKQETTDFTMNIMKHRNKPKCSWISSIFSSTLNLFYTIEIVFVLAIVFILEF